MTRYQLVWDDTRTGRLRADEDDSLRPLAWLRVIWGEGHEVSRVDVCGDGVQASDRRWLVDRTSIREAVGFCDAKLAALRPTRSSELMAAELGEPWKNRSVVDVV